MKFIGPQWQEQSSSNNNSSRALTFGTKIGDEMLAFTYDGYKYKIYSNKITTPNYIFGDFNYFVASYDIAILIRADIIKGFDDSVTWNSNYATSLMNNVTFDVTGYGYLPYNLTSNESNNVDNRKRFAPIDVEILNDIKYIQVTFFSTDASYTNRKCKAVRVELKN